MTPTTAFFWLVAGLTGGSALMVVLTTNIVRCAAWLLFTLAGVSILYFLLGADFVGSAQLIVYVGGTLVLVVFGVMLTAQGPFLSLKSGAGEWAGAVVAGLLFFGTLGVTVATAPWDATPPEVDPTATNSTSTRDLGLGFLGIDELAVRAVEERSGVRKPESSLTGFPPGRKDAAGQPLPAPRRTPVAYLLPFEIVSVHLLVVLIGAAYLARAKRRPGANA